MGSSSFVLEIESLSWRPSSSARSSRDLRPSFFDTVTVLRTVTTDVFVTVFFLTIGMLSRRAQLKTKFEQARGARQLE